MRKLINTILCVAFAAAAFAMFIAVFEEWGTFWHGLASVILACSSIAFSGKLTPDDDSYRRIS